MKMTHKSDPWKKYYEEKMSHMQKREFKYNTLFKQKKLHAKLFLNNITSIQKYNSRISTILICYYALCKGSK
jgi:hypothetical protein